jgi:hypothetical protein
LEKVIGWDIHTVTLLEDEVVVALNILELRVGLEIWYKEAHWAHVGR